jgi:endonuclease YncB( thermonuclease family)
MRLRLFIAMLLSLLIVSNAHAKQYPIRMFEGTVTKVVDGNNVLITDANGTKLKVRLYGVDAPVTEIKSTKSGKESKNGQPFGANAYEALFTMVINKPVRVEAMAIDEYKRTVAIVICNNRTINKELLSYGWGWANRKDLGSPYAAEYIQLEDKARKERRGLWQQKNPQPPWEYRKLQKKNSKKIF